MSRLSYARHRFPSEIIQHAVWLYFRFALSYRDIEDLLAERGVDVSYETVRQWALKFGRVYARRIRQRRPRPSDHWHVDEVFIRISGKVHYLWRAFDHEGEVLDVLVQSRRDKKAALKLLRRLLKRQEYLPDAIVTDRLPSYGAALRQLGLAERHAMLPAGDRTTEQRDRTSQPAVVNASTLGSDRRGRHNASSRPTPPSTIISISSAT
jgi:transposase-like protein